MQESNRSMVFFCCYCYWCFSFPRNLHAFTPVVHHRQRSLSSICVQQVLFLSSSRRGFTSTSISSVVNDQEDTAKNNFVSTTKSPAPILNGKRIFPYKILMTGLQGQQDRIPAVFCILNSSFQRQSQTDGWEAATFIGVTQDLKETLFQLYTNDTTELRVAHVRALSFTFPQPNAMQSVAEDWRQRAIQAGAKLENAWADDVLKYLFDDDDDDDDDTDDDNFDDDDEAEESMIMMANAMSEMQSSSSLSSSSKNPIVSPFASNDNTTSFNTTETMMVTPNVPFTRENVDSVLNEVRPYLIADGGNVVVERINIEERLVVLKLQGACGSCASSTVTMQMGIERVLKEQWPDVSIAQVDDDSSSLSKELQPKAVEAAIDRLKPALMAMGSRTVELRSVDVGTGTVVIQFIGSSKVRQGLELAILDVPFVKEVTFVESD